MDDRIRAAFDQVRATEEQKEQTRAFLDRARHRRTAPRRRLGALAACAVLLAVLMGGWWAWFVPTSAVSVESNSGLELELNRFDRVVAVQGGDDGLADSLRGLSYAQALELLLDELGTDQPVSITVSGAEGQCGRLLEQTQRCAAGHENVRWEPGAARATDTAMDMADGEIYKFLTHHLCDVVY